MSASIFQELRAVLAGLIDLVISPFSSRPRPQRLLRIFVQGLVRYRLEHDSIESEKRRYPSTEEAYLAYTAKKGLQPSTYVVGNAKAHWLGSKESAKTLVWFHGGGFVLPCNKGHFEWLSEVVEAVAIPGAPVAAVVLNYGLAPDHAYPTQLQQATDLLRHLVTDLGKRPQDIIIGGDSAGGNIALGVLSHILHPHPSIAKLDLAGPVFGTILISPWTSFEGYYDSYDRNTYSDYLARHKLAERWAGAFLAGKESDAYSEPNTADQTWFEGLGKIVQHVLVWGGGGEALIDPITDLTKMLRAAHNDVEFVVEPNAAHTDQIFEKHLGYTDVTQTTIAVREWYKSRAVI